MTYGAPRNVYISGPMRGFEAYNFPAFFEAEKELRERGARFVFNPARRDIDRARQVLPGAADRPIGTDPLIWGNYLVEHPEHFNLRIALNEDCEYITLHADAVVFLPGYEKSSGAKAERAIAEVLGLDLYYLDPDNGLIGLDTHELLYDVNGRATGPVSGSDVARAFGLDEIPFAEEPAREPARADKVNVAIEPNGEVRTTSSTGGQKGVKLARYDLIPAEPLRVLAEHYGRGAEKYDARQWEKGYEFSKSFGALQRHAWAFWNGEDIDAETGSPHLAAVAWHALAMMEFARTHPEHDDRPNTV